MTPLTDEQLAAIRARAKYVPSIGPLTVAFGDEVGYAVRKLRDDVPLLLAEIERLKAANVYSETIAAYSEAWIA